MTNLYGALTLQLKALSNLADIGGAITDGVIEASGRRVLNGAGDGSVRVSVRNATAAAALLSGRVAYCYVTDQVAGGAAMDICAFIIQSLVVDVTDQGTFLVASGADITHQLSYLSPGNNVAIDDGTGGVTTSDVTTIMTSAPSGWSTSFESGTGTANGTYHIVMGESVLEMLVKTAEQSGEFFRLQAISPPAKTIEWRRTNDSSGVTLRMTDPIGAYGSTAVGIILSLSEEREQAEIVTRVYPYGAGLAEARLDLTNITGANTGADPAGYTTDFAGNSITNDTLESALGYRIERHMDFSHIEPENAEDATQLITSAVALWNTAVNYLQERDTTDKVFYRVTCVVHADLIPGQTVDVVYAEYEGGTAGGTQVVDINGTFVIHEVTNSIGADGVRVTELLLGEGLRRQPTAARIQAGALISHQDTIRHAPYGLAGGFVPDSRVLNTELPVLIDGLQTADMSADRTLSIHDLDTYGAANQIPGANAGATAWEYKTLTEGAGISITHGAGTITFANTGTTTDISGAAFVTIGNTAALSAERALTAGTGISIVDGGANGAVTISATGVGAPTDATYVVMSLSGSLSAERVLTAGDGLDLTDGGANGNASLVVDVTDILGNGLTESSNNINLGTPGTITSTSTNAVTASSHTHAIDGTLALANAAYVTIGNTAALSAERALTAGDGLDLTDGGANSTVTLLVDVTDILGVGLNEDANNNIVLGTPSSITSTSTNSVSGTTHTHALDSTVALANAAYVTIGNTAALSAERALVGGAGLTLTDGGANGNATLNVGAGLGITVNANDVALTTPGTLTVATTNSSTGSHTHAITSSSNPGAAAAILASNSSGYLQLVRVGLGTAPTQAITAVGSINIRDGANGYDVIKLNNSDVIASDADIRLANDGGIAAAANLYINIDDNNDSANAALIIGKDAPGSGATALLQVNEAGNVTINSGTWVGLGSAAGRIVFTDATPDTVNVSSGNLLVSGGSIYVNDSSNADSVIGVTINQGANDDTAFAIKSSDVVHFMTDYEETDTYFSIEKFIATEGGVRMWGFSEGSVAINLRAAVTTGNTTKGSTALGALVLQGEIRSGTATTTLGSNRNVLVVRDRENAIFIVDAEGDTHRDGTDNTFDEYEDAHLARAFDLAMSPGSVIRSDFDDFLQYGRADLIAAGVLHEDGFYNESQLVRLHNGAIWQAYTRQRQLEARIEQLERRLINNGI